MIRKIWQWYATRRYVAIGLRWGDARSYLLDDNGIGHLFNSLRYWETQYMRLGFRPVPRERWILAGGYGRPYEDFLGIPL